MVKIPEENNHNPRQENKIQGTIDCQIDVNIKEDSKTKDHKTLNLDSVLHVFLLFSLRKV